MQAGLATGPRARYVARGVDPALATKVAEQLMAHDALGAHARDELGISETLSARPIKQLLRRRRAFPWGRPCRCWLSWQSPCRV
jgi:hypothetical protein